MLKVLTTKFTIISATSIFLILLLILLIHQLLCHIALQGSSGFLWQVLLICPTISKPLALLIPLYHSFLMLLITNLPQLLQCILLTLFSSSHLLSFHSSSFLILLLLHEQSLLLNEILTCGVSALSTGKKFGMIVCL